MSYIYIYIFFFFFFYGQLVCLLVVFLFFFSFFLFFFLQVSPVVNYKVEVKLILFGQNLCCYGKGLAFFFSLLFDVGK